MRCGAFVYPVRLGFWRKNVLKMCLKAIKEREYTQKIIDVWEKKIPEIIGTRYFWNCEAMIHRRPDYYVGVNMVSARKNSTEVCNTSTSHTEFLCDGSTFLMKARTNTTWSKLLDFSAIPGTTGTKCIQKADYANWRGSRLV